MLGRVDEAPSHEYEMQVRLADGDARAHSDLGTALLAKQAARARRSRSSSARSQLDPRRAAFHSNLGYALQLGGKIADAIAEYREALRLDPKLASAWINLATALARDPAKREAKRARRSSGRARSIPTDPRVKANLEELDALERGGGPPP